MKAYYKKEVMSKEKAFSIILDNLYNEIGYLNRLFNKKPKEFNYAIDNMLLELNGLKKLNI